MTDPPIPPRIWARIVAWLRAGGTGRIILDAHGGHVHDASITERIQAEDAPTDRGKLSDSIPGQ
jgi:hypothetical protein